MADKNHALYLYKDGEGSPKLFHGDDVADARANGWKEPDFKKSNGSDWNAEDDVAQQDAAADFAKPGEQAVAKADKQNK